MGEAVAVKMPAYIPFSIELLFDVTAWAELPLWARKEWFRQGYGLGSQKLESDWPRPAWRSREEYRRASHARRLRDRIRDRCRDD